MNKIFKTAVLIVVVGLVSVACTQVKSTPILGAPTSKEDLKNNFMGEYVGVLPCASCPGIETTVTLLPTGTASVQEIYIDRDIKPTLNKGKWEVSKDLSYVKISFEGKNVEPVFYKFDTGSYIEMLDREGKIIDSKLNYRLRNTK